MNMYSAIRNEFKNMQQFKWIELLHVARSILLFYYKSCLVSAICISRKLTPWGNS